MDCNQITYSIYYSGGSREPLKSLGTSVIGEAGRGGTKGGKHPSAEEAPLPLPSLLGILLQCPTQNAERDLHLEKGIRETCKGESATVMGHS